MSRSSPQFPAFDTWQDMSESEQDALIGRLEAQKHRRLLRRIGLALATVTGAAGLIAAALARAGGLL